MISSIFLTTRTSIPCRRKRSCTSDCFSETLLLSVFTSKNTTRPCFTATKSGAPGISPAHRCRPRVDWFGICITIQPAYDRACTIARWTSLSFRGKYGLLGLWRKRIAKVSHNTLCLDWPNKKAPVCWGRGPADKALFVPSAHETSARQR